MYVKSYTMMLYRQLAKLLTRSKLIASNTSQNDCIYAVYKGQHGCNVLQSVVIVSAMHFSRSVHLYIRMYVCMQPRVVCHFTYLPTFNDDNFLLYAVREQAAQGPTWPLTP